MAPKQKAIAELGALARHGNGWRVKVKVGQQQRNGPTHPTRAAAQADLDAAQQCTSRNEMLTFLTTLVLTTLEVPQLRRNNDVGQLAAGDGAHLAGGGANSEQQASGHSGVGQPSAGAKAVMQSVRESSSRARGACGQLPAKKARVAIEDSSSGVSQSVAVQQLSSLAGRVLNTESSADLKRGNGVAGNNEENRKTLLLQLRRPHYDAMKNRRKVWEARPLFDCSGQQTIYDKLAVVGNAAVLQSGAGTNDRVCIAEVRRYIPQGLSYPLEDMVVELGADLLPDVADTRARAQVYESLYGDRCTRGFVAMRIEWPNEGEAAIKSQGTHGSAVSVAATSSMAGTAPVPRARRTCTSPNGCGKPLCERCYPC